MSKKGRKQIDVSRIETIKDLRESGLTYREICEKLGCGNSTISRYTVEQPTPIPVNVPKATWKKYTNPIIINLDSKGVPQCDPHCSPEPAKKEVDYKQIVDSIIACSKETVNEICLLIKEDQVNRELRNLQVEYDLKVATIKGKYNVK